MIWGKTYTESTKFTEKRRVFLYLPRTLACGRGAWWQYVYRQWWADPDRQLDLEGYPFDRSCWIYTLIDEEQEEEK